MSPKTRELLAHFAVTFKWSAAPLPSQMGPFWEFVIHAYKTGEYQITQEQFLEVVGKSNKQREVVVKLYMHEQYRNGIQLLKQFEGK